MSPRYLPRSHIGPQDLDFQWLARFRRVGGVLLGLYSSCVLLPVACVVFSVIGGHM